MQLTTEEFHDLAQRLYSPKVGVMRPATIPIEIEAAWHLFFPKRLALSKYLTEKELFEAGFRAARGES